MNYDVIIGLDFGHGEVAAIAVRRERPDDYMPLSLTQDRDKVIPTVIHYGDGGVVSIGNNAANKEGMIAYFKTAPGKWTLSNGEPLQNKGHSVKDIMGDFFRELMKNILAYNADSILKEGDVIYLVVGCPSSPSWTDDANRMAYEALIREATGIGNVSVVPESRGAIFSAYSGRTLKGVNAKDGIAVFDFGSLTADFTYIKMGEMIMERSWDLGASQIEKAMLRQVLKLGGWVPQDLYREQEGLLLHKLRREKEMYYSGTLMVERSSVDLICTDDFGDPIMVENRLGKLRPKKQEVRYPHENSDMDEFMADAVEQETFEILQNGTPIGRYSWHAGCKAFFASMKALLNGKGLPHRMIVLTGGASRMPFVRALAGEVFADTEIVVEENPSITVARGLCIIGDIDLRVSALIDRDRAGLYGFGHDAYLKALDAIATKIAVDAVQNTQRYLNGLDRDITFGELKAEVEADVQALVSGAEMGSAIDAAMDGVVADIVAQVVERANEAGKQLYRNQAALDVFHISSDDVSRQVSADIISRFNQMDIGQIISPEKLANMVVMKAVYAVLIVVAVVLMFINPIIGLAALFAEDLLEKLVLKVYTRNPKRVITLAQIQKSRAKYEKEQAKSAENIKKSVVETMSAQFNRSVEMQNALDSCVDDCMTMAYGIVAMQTFEQTDIQ